MTQQQAAQATQERLRQQALKLRGQTNRCSEEEKPTLEAQIQALLYEHLLLDPRGSSHPLTLPLLAIRSTRPGKSATPPKRTSCNDPVWGKSVCLVAELSLTRRRAGT